MQLKHNIFANYLSTIYVTVVGIVILPLYIRYMGAEAYGLVGFFTMLQAMFALLDLGLTPTISRETARNKAGVTTSQEYRGLVRALSIIFAIIALVGGGLLFSLSSTISGDWLNIEKLPLAEVVFSLQVMSISVALRWMGGLYRGVVTGNEKIVWLSGFNAFLATLRFIIVLPVMFYFGANITVFFLYQLIIAALELMVLVTKARSLLPLLSSEQKLKLGWTLAPVRPLIRFSLSIALTSSIWVFVTQTDKIIISKLLTLTEYGYFTLAVLVAGGIHLLASPVGVALRPRLANLFAEGKDEELLSLYNASTQFVAIIVSSAVATVVLFAPHILFVWTGSKEISDIVADTLVLYTIGYGMQALGAFPFYLQFAVGKLRLHVIGSVLFALILIPSILYLVSAYGMIGAGWAWLLCNSVFFVFWVPIIHHSLYKGLHIRWIFKEIMPIVVSLFIMALIFRNFFAIDLTSSVEMTLLNIVGFGIASLIVAVVMARDVRKFLVEKLVRKKQHD